MIRGEDVSFRASLKGANIQRRPTLKSHRKRLETHAEVYLAVADFITIVWLEIGA